MFLVQSARQVIQAEEGSSNSRAPLPPYVRLPSPFRQRFAVQQRDSPGHGGRGRRRSRQPSCGAHEKERSLLFRSGFERLLAQTDIEANLN